VQECERLEIDLARARTRPAPVSPAGSAAVPEVLPSPSLEPLPPPPPAPAPARPREELLSEVLKLVGQLERTEPPAETPKERPRKDVFALQGKVLDTTKPARERVDALRELRTEGPEARSAVVVNSMVELLRTSGDDRVRVDICRHLKGDTSEVLKRQLLTTLQSDASSKVREEAAEALGPMNGDDFVRKALEAAATSDPSEAVQRQARGALRRTGDDR
jgi:hypothetical protein